MSVRALLGLALLGGNLGAPIAAAAVFGSIGDEPRAVADTAEAGAATSEVDRSQQTDETTAGSGSDVGDESQEQEFPAPLMGAPEIRRLSLDEYVREVLQQNLDLAVAELDTQIDAAAVRQAGGAFDPELFARVVGGESETPTSSVFTAQGSQTLDASTGLRGLLRTGATYDFTYTLDYTRQKPSNPFFDFNPTYTSSVVLSLTQPLLRGAGPTVTEGNETRARLFVDRGDFTLMDSVQRKAHEAVLAYWNLVFEIRSYHTAKEAHEVALALVENNTKKKEAGVMTILDVARAESEEKRRMEELIRSENRLLAAQDELKGLLHPGDRPGDWDGAILPTTEPGPLDRPLPDVASAVESALTTRPDLHSLAVDLQIAELELVLAEDGKKPQLDVFGTYGLSGLAGRLTDPTLGRDEGSTSSFFYESLEPIFSSQFERWTMGAEFSYPIGNRGARAGVESARVSKERAWMIWSARRNDVVLETRTALRDVQSARARIVASAEARRLAEEQLRAEEVRFGLGSSTTFEVRESQRDLFEAQDTETRALLDYEIELAGLELVQGNLAERFGVQFEDERPPAGALLND